MIKRATESDVTRINEIMNDPSIRPFVAPGDYPFDLTGATSRLMVFWNDSGVIIGESMGDGEYLALSGFLPEGRGLPCHIAHKQAIDIMFFEYDTFRIVATVDINNLKSLRHMKALGFKSFTLGCKRVHVEMDYTQWALRSDACLDAGRAFVDLLGRPMLEAEMRMLGAFLTTIQRSRGRYTGKAFKLFNRFAKLSMLEYIAPVNEEWTRFFYCGKVFEITHNGLMEVRDAR